MNNHITTLSRERLKQLADENTICKVSWDERIEMARALLAMLGKGCLHHWISSEGRTDSGWLCSKCGDYDGPPAPSTPDGWKLVPVEPTIVMTEAAIDEFNESRNMRDTYYALLEHALTAPGGE